MESVKGNLLKLLRNEVKDLHEDDRTCSIALGNNVTKPNIELFICVSDEMHKCINLKLSKDGEFKGIIKPHKKWGCDRERNELKEFIEKNEIKVSCKVVDDYITTVSIEWGDGMLQFFLEENLIMDDLIGVNSKGELYKYTKSTVKLI